MSPGTPHTSLSAGHRYLPIGFLLTGYHDLLRGYLLRFDITQQLELPAHRLCQYRTSHRGDAPSLSQYRT
eukprot:2530657-Rhodomonas_salina.2